MPFYERKEKILNLLQTSKELTTSQISKVMYVSEPTVRRDLKKLEESNDIIRTHNGARLEINPADLNIPLFKRIDYKSDAKAYIGKKASELICDGDVIMLDASTTAFNILPFIKEKKNIIIITSGAKTAVTAGQMDIRTVCTGGRMITSSFSFVGSDAVNMIKNYNAVISFISCHGISESGLVSDNSIEENDIRAAMMKHSKKTVLLCDSTKLGKVCIHNLCHLSHIDKVICNEELPERMKCLLNQKSY